MHTLKRAHAHAQPPRGGTALVAGGEEGGLNCGPPASITWDIFYMTEPSAGDWTHMTTFRQLGWIQMCIFGKKRAQYFYLRAPSCTISFMSLTPISYSKQTDNWRIGIEVLMRKRQTEAEMKHWLPIQIAVITISTLKLCNNLHSNALLRWGGRQKKGK